MKTLVLYACLLTMPCVAQDLPPETEQQLENMGEENLEDDALLQSLAHYRKHPIDLNAATADEFQQLRLLNALQLESFFRYRAAFGKLLSVYELQAIPAFDVITIRRLKAYVFVGNAERARDDLSARFRNSERYVLVRWSRTLERAKGYNASLPTHYLGDPNRLLLTIRSQHKTNLYYGLTADKDAGEQFFRGAQRSGFDFYSGHLFLRNLGRVKALALGDYAVNLGQGLTQWQSLAFGKSADVLNIKRQSPVLLPYRSPGEFLFNRGAGVTFDLKACEATVFVSEKRVSGNLVADSVGGFSSFATSGYYRTPAEIADRYRLRDASAGGNFTFTGKALKAGLNIVYHRFSRPMQSNAEPYNHFAFRGREALNASIDYACTVRNVHFFGEAAVDQKRHLAFVQGALISLAPAVDLSLLYRHFSPAYQSLFGNAFGENTLPANEYGLYTGMLFRLSPAWQLSAYADVYRFPFLKYRVSAPTSGTDYLVQLSYSPSRDAAVYLRYRSENKPLNAAGPVIPSPVESLRQNLRLHISRQLARVVTVQARTEVSWYRTDNGDPENGFLCFVDVTGRLAARVKASARLAYFETGGYDTRIYAYENDVLYGFSIPAFFNKGYRFYMVCSYAFGHNCTLWLRLAQTANIDGKTIGSGLDALPGNSRTEAKVQVLFNL